MPGVARGFKKNLKIIIWNKNFHFEKNRIFSAHVTLGIPMGSLKNLKYQRFTPSDCNDIRVRKCEFVATT